MSENAPPKRKAAAETKEQPALVWTPDMVKDLEHFIENLADKYVGYKKTEAEFDRRYAEAMARHDRLVALLLLAFLAGVICVVSILTAWGRVSGDALLFLVGTMTGYVFSFVYKVLFLSAQPPPEAPAEG